MKVRKKSPRSHFIFSLIYSANIRKALAKCSALRQTLRALDAARVPLLPSCCAEADRALLRPVSKRLLHLPKVCHCDEPLRLLHMEETNSNNKKGRK